jgi:prepilin-type processing-associated H-X9-DG protein
MAIELLFTRSEDSQGDKRSLESAMGQDYKDKYAKDKDSDDCYGADRVNPSTSVRSIIWAGLVAVALLGLVISFLASSLLRSKEMAGKQKCRNNLKGIGIAMILYSNDYRYFPHMTSLKKEHNKKHISDVYRTLIQFKYIDNAEVLICPKSEEAFAAAGKQATDKSRLWDWKGQTGSNQAACRNSAGLDVYKNTELSYTYLRGLGTSSSVSDKIITADKNYHRPGGRYDGYNLGFADGHVRYVPLYEKALLKKLYKSLQMAADESPH